jgi:hypothetical protein
MPDKLLDELKDTDLMKNNVYRTMSAGVTAKSAVRDVIR